MENFLNKVGIPFLAFIFLTALALPFSASAVSGVVATQSDKSVQAYYYLNDGLGNQCHSITQDFVADRSGNVTELTVDYWTAWFGQKSYPTLGIYTASGTLIENGFIDGSGYFSNLGTWTFGVAQLERGEAYYWQMDWCDHGQYQGFNYPSWVNGSGSGAPYYVIRGNVVPDPVLVVPGILGTQINSSSTGEEVWPKVASLLGSPGDEYLNDLSLDNQGNQISGKEMVASGVIESALSSPFYGNILDRLTSIGYASGTTFLTLPYDWRFDLTAESEKLGDVIGQAVGNSERGKVDIVAHSMGGLFVKQYLADHPEASSSIGKIILSGVPQLGSLKAFKTLNFGDDFDLKWFGLGLNQGRAKEISQNMPAVYELLPSRRYIDLNGGYVKDLRDGQAHILNYDETKQLMTSNPNDSRNPDLLNLADTFHQALDSQSSNAGDRYNLVGCSKATIGGFRLYTGGKVELTSTIGDGTVPFGSATYGSAGARSYFASRTSTGANDHLGLIRDSGPVDLIQNILEDRPDDLPSGISVSSATCFPAPNPENPVDEFVVSSHSPAVLHVYDAQNRHVGPNAQGDIELQIPGAQYEVVGHNHFALLPPGVEYRVVLQATGQGTVDFETEAWSGTSTQHKVTYLDVPLATASATIEGVFAVSTSTPTLSIDNDGDGTPDATASPTGVLNASSSADIDPPELIMPAISPLVAQSSTTVVTFGASDEGSGLAWVRGTLDGVVIQSGDPGAFSSLGAHVFRLESKDIAGNPAAQEILFTVARQAVFNPDADTFVSSVTPDVASGTVGFLRVSGDGSLKALTHFNGVAIASEIASGTVLSASLKFTVDVNDGAWTPSSTLGAYRMRRLWAEQSATWHCPEDADTGNQVPDCAGNEWNMGNGTSSDPFPWVGSATGFSVMTNATSVPVVFDLTSDVAGFLNGTMKRSWSWLIGNVVGSEPGSASFAANETRRAPSLSIFYSP